MTWIVDQITVMSMGLVLFAVCIGVVLTAFRCAMWTIGAILIWNWNRKHTKGPTP